MLKGNLDNDLVLHAFAVNDLIVERRLSAVQVSDELPDSAFVVEGVSPDRILTLIIQGDFQILREKCRLPETDLQGIVIVDRLLKDLRIRKEGDFCSVLLRIAVSDHRDRLNDLALCEDFLIDLSVTVHIDLETGREGIHDRSAHAVQSAGNFISPAAELSAGVKDRENHFQRRDACFFLNIDRNSPAIVQHGDGIVRVDRHIDLAAETCQRFIDRIVHDLIDQVVKPPGRCGPYIHSRSLSDSFQSFKDLDLIRIVFRAHKLPP